MVNNDSLQVVVQVFVWKFQQKNKKSSRQKVEKEKDVITLTQMVGKDDASDSEVVEYECFFRTLSAEGVRFMHDSLSMVTAIPDLLPAYRSGVIRTLSF